MEIVKKQRREVEFSRVWGPLWFGRPFLYHKISLCPRFLFCLYPFLTHHGHFSSLFISYSLFQALLKPALNRWHFKKWAHVDSNCSTLTDMSYFALDILKNCRTLNFKQSLPLRSQSGFLFHCHILHFLRWADPLQSSRHVLALCRSSIATSQGFALNTCHENIRNLKCQQRHLLLFCLHPQGLRRGQQQRWPNEWTAHLSGSSATSGQTHTHIHTPSFTHMNPQMKF